MLEHAGGVGRSLGVGLGRRREDRGREGTEGGDGGGGGGRRGGEMDEI